MTTLKIIFVPCSWRKWTLHINKLILYTYICSQNLLGPYIENQTFHPSPVHDDLSESIHCLRTLVKEWFPIICWCKWSMRALPVVPFVLSNYMVKYTKPFILYIWNKKTLICIPNKFSVWVSLGIKHICYSQFCLKCVNLNTSAMNFKRWNLYFTFNSPLSDKDWELTNSRIWLAEMDIDHALDFPI